MSIGLSLNSRKNAALEGTKHEPHEPCHNPSSPSRPTHHIGQSDVQKHPSRDGKDHVGGEAAPEEDAEDEADVTRHRRQHVEENGLWDAHPGVEQDDKVACRGRQTQRGHGVQSSPVVLEVYGSFVELYFYLITTLFLYGTFHLTSLSVVTA